VWLCEIRECLVEGGLTKCLAKVPTMLEVTLYGECHPNQSGDPLLFFKRRKPYLNGEEVLSLDALSSRHAPAGGFPNRVPQSR